MDFLNITENTALISKMQKFGIAVSGISKYDEKGNVTSLYHKSTDTEFDVEKTQFIIEYNSKPVAFFNVQWLDGVYSFGYPVTPKGNVVEPKKREQDAITEVFNWLQIIADSMLIPCDNGIPFYLLSLMLHSRSVETKKDGFSLSSLTPFDWAKVENKLRKISSLPNVDTVILYQLTGFEGDIPTVEATEA